MRPLSYIFDRGLEFGDYVDDGEQPGLPDLMVGSPVLPGVLFRFTVDGVVYITDRYVALREDLLDVELLAAAAVIQDLGRDLGNDSPGRTILAALRPGPGYVNSPHPFDPYHLAHLEAAGIDVLAPESSPVRDAKPAVLMEICAAEPCGVLMPLARPVAGRSAVPYPLPRRVGQLRDLIAGQGDDADDMGTALDDDSLVTERVAWLLAGVLWNGVFRPADTDFVPEEVHQLEVLVDRNDDDQDIVTYRFTCAAGRLSPCHSYVDCGCEDSRAPGHKHHQTMHDECWLETWFAEPENLVYEGSDAADDGLVAIANGTATFMGTLVPTVSHKGLITTRWYDEGVLAWDFARETPTEVP